MDLGTLMMKWYRGEATPNEVQTLLAAKYIRVTNPTYGHIGATIKGIRASNKKLGEMQKAG